MPTTDQSQGERKTLRVAPGLSDGRTFAGVRVMGSPPIASRTGRVA